MFKIIYWLIAIVMFVIIMVFLSFCEEFDEMLIDSFIEGLGDSIKITKTGWHLVMVLMYMMACICWPIALILFILMYFGYKRAE